MRPLPTLRQLQFFLALVRRESFSRAAEDCLVSQSTLSAAIKELENLLQAQLVDRSTKRFGLTPLGHEVAAHAAPILAGVEDLAQMTQERLPLEGPFHLGVIPTIAPFLLPKAAPEIARAHPRLELFMREDLTAKLGERLSAGLLDAALLALPYDLPGTEIIDVGEDPFVYAAGPGGCDPADQSSPMTLDDLARDKLLLLEDGHCLRDHAIAACRLQDPDTAAAYSGTSLFTLAQMVRAGLGVTLLPKMAVDAGFAAAAGLETREFAAPTPKRRIGIVWRRGSGRRIDAEMLAAIFRDAMQANAA